MITAPTAGPHLRVVDPDWDDPLDATYAQRVGGRWNTVGSYPVLYLNATIGAARANASQKLTEQRALGIGLENLDPAGLPELVEVEVPAGTAADLRSDDGLRAVGLPTTYPRTAAGEIIPHERCQPIGAEAHDRRLDGVLARCAAPGAQTLDSELAWFPLQGRSAAAGARQAFHDWYPT